MTLANKRPAWVAGAIFALLGIGGCTSASGRFIAPPAIGNEAVMRDLDSLLLDNPLAAGENIKAIALQRSAHSAHVLVQVRDREPVHYHADSDITVLMLRGSGVIHMGKQVLATKAGDAIFVPRGAVHYFVNTGNNPAAALVTYSPPPGPDDRVLVSPAP